MIENLPFVREIRDTAENMYRLGWNERNGGNLSLYVTEDELADCQSELSVKRMLRLTTPFPELAGECFLITGTGKYFKNISKAPAENLGLIRISVDGSSAGLL